MAAESETVEVAPGVRVLRRFVALIWNYEENPGFRGEVVVAMDDDGQPMLDAFASYEPMSLEQLQSVDWAKVLKEAVKSGALDAWAREHRPGIRRPPPPVLAAAASVRTGRRSYNRLTKADKAKALQLHTDGGVGAVSEHFNVGERQARRMVASARADLEGGRAR